MNITILIVLGLTVIYVVGLLIKTIVKGKMSFSVGSFDLSILFIAILYIVSTFFVSPSVMDTLILPGSTLVIVLGASLYFLISNTSPKTKIILSYILYSLGVIYSILVLLTIAEVIKFFPLTGYMLQSVILLSILIPFAIYFLIQQKELTTRSLISVTIFILLFAISALTFSINNNKFTELHYPDFKTSNEVLKATLKQNPVFGVGSGNYLESFNKFRPVDYYNLPIWENKFNYGRTYIITLITETGFLGALAFISLIITFLIFVAKYFKTKFIESLSPFLFLIFAIVFPISNINLILLFVILGIITTNKNYDHLIKSKHIVRGVATMTLVLIFFTLYKSYPVIAAEINYAKAIKAISTGNTKDGYELVKKAINLNSKVDRYHKTMSLINIAVADSIGNKKETPFFIQASIDEAKAAVAINNRNSSNWEHLGKTYKLLTPLGEGSHQFAIDAYNEAIALDPINPNLRIALGEIYMFKKDYKLAIETFKLAVLAKDNHPNSHFNLALAYKENKEIGNAKAELIKTIELIQDDASSDYEHQSANYKKVKLELDNLK